METRPLKTVHGLQHVGVIFTLFSFWTHDIDAWQLLFGREKNTVGKFEMCILVFPSYYELKFLLTANANEIYSQHFLGEGKQGRDRDEKEKWEVSMDFLLLTEILLVRRKKCHYDFNMWPSVLAYCE